jgi:hypothetical protein
VREGESLDDSALVVDDAELVRLLAQSIPTYTRSPP